MKTSIATPLALRNGKSFFILVPSVVIAGGSANCGYEPITRTEALLALGWIFRKLAQWKTKRNVYDLMQTGSGCGHNSFPKISFEEDGAIEHLRLLLAHLLIRNGQPDVARFVRTQLGFRSLEKALRVPVRKPADDLFGWLAHLRGCRLKVSPNEFHKGAVWLHGAVFGLNRTATRWRVSVTYSYRHEDSSWGLRFEQNPGENFETFEKRVWAELAQLIQWRHPEAFYSHFMVSEEEMKKNELKSCAGAEEKMFTCAAQLRNLFTWGASTSASWQNQIAEALLSDEHEQFRENKKIEMTPARLRSLRKWIREDRVADAAKKAQKAAA